MDSRERIHAFEPEFVPPSPRDVVLVIDATYFGKRGKGFGILVAKDIRSGAVVSYWFIRYETVETYRKIKESIEAKGFHIQAVTLDGRRGIRELFDSVPVQMCHFHQQAILTRYLTRKPKHPAAQKLKEIAATLGRVSRCRFQWMLSAWHRRYSVSDRTF
jgi:hypothetical protein